MDPLSFSDPLDTSLNIETNRPVGLPDAPPIKLLKEVESGIFEMEIDYSSMSAYLECPRRYELRSVFSREARRDGSATGFGGLFHLCEEYRLLNGGFSDEVAAKQRSMVQDYFRSRTVVEGDHRTPEMMMKVLKLYRERYSQDNWHNHILSDSNGLFVERPFRIHMCDVPVDAVIPYNKDLLVEGDHPSEPFYVSKIRVFFTGKADIALGFGSDGNWIVDHKTSSRGGEEFQEYFRLSLQTRGYTWAGQYLTGQTFEGLLLNALVIRPPTRTGISIQLDRIRYRYSQDSLDEWRENFCHISSDIVASLARGYFYQSSLSFKSPCTWCDYKDNCTLDRNLRSSDLYSELYRNHSWSPLLTNE